ncbi:hypothetical protein SAMN05216466_10794 [Paraburkholderia phenazinium]|uniref:Uncharacterized protein n=1 Tax=Paraburkholderia phenazinium TaxID=60549 RepID=A0A1G7ZMF4_9BURK|nr:hypothetical protein [Paraburkholderia phenazinium]SDH09932.1 hypothetical protein SAMN05216466_10794 [Paraburkholderia phenazinium]
MTDLTKTYRNSGDMGLTTIQGLEVEMTKGVVAWDESCPEHISPLRWKITVAPTTAQLSILLRDMPDIFDTVDPEGE